jgi:hypothetical protein
VGVAVCLDWLKAESSSASPVPTGHGMVKCEHGLLPIPPPSVAHLLRGVPLAECPIEGELTTPTGAAIVAMLADAYGPLPAMTVERIGYGAGQKDFPQANLLRVLVGEEVGLESAKPQAAGTAPRVESIVVLETNLDDATGVAIGNAVERLWEAGALDVSLVAIQIRDGCHNMNENSTVNNDSLYKDSGLLCQPLLSIIFAAA